MEDKSKKWKKVPIREEDVSTLLLRYSVKTVLALLQEVAKVAGKKIDWSEIVKNTAIGISSARECQMLWRHLAYGQTLSDQFDNDTKPMEDDSDLEYEIESFPAVSREASVEAAAYVRVLMASDSPIDSHVLNNSTIEAPLIINVPKFKVPSDGSLLCSAMQGTNISIPVSIEKELLSSGTCGGKRPKDGKSGVDSARRQKRRGRSTEDDLILNAALLKHGEQNCANISSADFKNDRNAPVLSNRWIDIKKKRANLNAGPSSDLSKERMATSRAILIALESDNQRAARQMGNVGTKSLQYASSSPSNPQLGIVGPLKSQVTTERPPMKCCTSPNPMVQAAAVAAGARIATPADASSVIEATARSQNVIHIRTGVGVQRKSPTTSMLNQPSVNTHFSCNGPTKTPIPSYSAQIEQANSIKPEHLVVQRNPAGGTLVVDVSSGMVNSTASIPNPEVAKTVEAGEHLISTLGGNTRGDQASSSFSDPINQTQDDQVALPCSEVQDHGKKLA